MTLGDEGSFFGPYNEPTDEDREALKDWTTVGTFATRRHMGPRQARWFLERWLENGWVIKSDDEITAVKYAMKGQT